MRKSLFLFCLIISAFFGFSQNNSLVLNGGYIRMNGGTAANPIFMVVNQPQTTGIIRPGGGHIHSENQYNHLRWVTSTTVGNYVFPFGVGGTAADYIPFEFNKATAGNANLTISTFSTNTGNLPFANPVSLMPQALSSIDRFWDIRSSTTVTANLIFRYRGIENTVTTCADDTIKAQFWNNSAGPWSAMAGPGNPGVTSGIGTVGSILNQTYFQPTETVWALTTIPISPTISASANISCNGSNNGSATVTTTGGLGPYSFSWTPTGSIGNVNVGLTPGIHTVVVTGANGCNQTRTVSISQPPAVTLTVNQTQVTCSALASASLTPTGGTPTYTAYTWNPAISTTNTATGLGAGNYTATVTDNNGCQKSTVFSITTNTLTPIVSSATTGSLNCSTLSVNVSATTSTTPVSYTWSGTGITAGAGTGTISVNQGGIFNYTVANTSNGCVTTGSQAVTQNTNALVATSSNSGTLTCATTTVDLLGGPSSGVIYQWSGPSFSGGTTSQNAVGTAPGIYTLNIIDAATSCTAQATTVVTQNITTPVTVASSTGSLTCSSASVNLNSSLAGANYTWTAPGGSSIASGTNSQNAIGLGSGTYTLLVVNPTNGCSVTATTAANINTVSPITSASTAGSITCVTNTINLTSVLAGANYTWTAPGGASITSGINSQNAVGQGLGTYTLIVQNITNGCTSTVVTSANQNTTTPTITMPSSQTITCLSPTVSLVGSAVPSSCTPVWTGGVCGGSTSYSATACSPNIYTLTVTNPANGCANSETVSVLPSSGIPIVTASNTGSITCTNLSVGISASTTMTPVSYSWSGPGAIVGSSSPNGTVTVGGIYQCVVSNTITGCTSTVTTLVNTNTTIPTTTINVSGILTCSISSVTLTGASTSTATTNLWNTGATTQSISVNVPGPCTLTVTDSSNGCSFTTSTTVTQNTLSPLGLNAGTNQTLTCSSTSVALNGSITSPTNAIINWTGAGVCGPVSSLTSTVCSAGVYTLTATDGSNGCASTSTVQIFSNPGAPTATISSSALVLDCNNASQSVTVTSTPSSNVTYTWNTPPSSLSTNGDMATFNLPNTYICTITNTLTSCSSNVQVTITSNTLIPTIAISGTQTLTCGSPSVIINTTVTPVSSYSWQGSGIVSGQSTGAIVVNASGTYTVNVTNSANGCTNTATSNITSNTTIPSATINATSSNSIITCLNTSVTLSVNVTPIGGYTYTWSTSSNNTSINASTAGIYNVLVYNSTTGCTTTAQYAVSSNTATPNITASNAVIPCGSSTVNVVSTSTDVVTYNWSTSTGNIITNGSATALVGSAGIYTVTVTNAANGCTNSAIASVTQTSVNALFTANPISGTAPLGINFINQSTGATSYLWSFGDSNNNTSTITDPSHTYNTTGTYTVLLTAINGSCSDTATLTIEVYSASSIVIPNVFTPNGDGFNDVFKINTNGIKEITCDIFNRWGSKIYTLNGVNDSWDGNGSADGTYFYILKATGYDGKEFTENGFINLFK